MRDTKDEALKLALEALETKSFDLHSEWGGPFNGEDKLRELRNKAITAIKQALEQPEERYTYGTPLLDVFTKPAPVQEPVAWMHVMDNTEGLKANGKGIVSITQKRKHPFGKPGVDFSKSYPVTSTPLYATPPAQPAHDYDALYAAWLKVGADVKGLNWGDFVAKLKENT